MLQYNLIILLLPFLDIGTPIQWTVYSDSGEDLLPTLAVHCGKDKTVALRACLTFGNKALGNFAKREYRNLNFNKNIWGFREREISD